MGEKEAMTTPERLKHRQQMIGVFLVVLAILTVGQGFYNQKQTREQRQCLATQITLLTDSLSARGELTQRASDATTDVILAVASAKTSEAVRAALDQFVTTQEDINEARTKHPFPPFPNGQCDA